MVSMFKKLKCVGEDKNTVHASQHLARACSNYADSSRKGRLVQFLAARLAWGWTDSTRLPKGLSAVSLLVWHMGR